MQIKIIYLFVKYILFKLYFQEIYTCKQRGCGKTFTNQDEYKTHEALEALKIRFM